MGFSLERSTHCGESRLEFRGRARSSIDRPMAHSANIVMSEELSKLTNYQPLRT